MLIVNIYIKQKGHIMKKFITIFLSLLFLSFNSLKAEMAIGISAGMHEIGIKGSETLRQSSKKASAKHTERTAVPEVFVEILADNGTAFGVAYIPTRELGNKSRSDTTTTGDGQDTGTYTAKAELENVIQVYADVPFAELMGASVYAKVGLQHVTINTLESLNSGSNYPDKDVMGFTVGLGARGDLPYENLFYKADLTYTNFAEYKADSDATLANTVEAELDAIAAKLSLGYKF